MWSDRGTWWEDGDGLVILESDNQIEARRLTVISANDRSVTGVRVAVNDADRKPVSGARIQLGDGLVHKFTDARGVAEFTPSEIAGVVGPAEWLVIVSDLGTDFTRIPHSQNIHEIRITPGTPRPRRTYFARIGALLKDLNGLGITFDRCPEAP